MNIWGRLGISVAIVAAFSIVMTEVLQGKDFYQVYRWAICAVLLALGAFLLVIGRFVNAKIRETQRGEGEEAAQGPFLLINLEYWGLILTIFGVIVIFIVPYKKVEARAAATRANPPAVKKVAPVATNEAPAPPPTTNAVIFPKLKLQGIVYKRDRPSALINGRTYFISNRVGEVTVIAIGTTNVVLELNGHQRELLLDD